MNFKRSLRSVALTSAATLALVACSDTTISSPGATEVTTSPVTTTPPATTPPSATIDLIPAGGCPVGTEELNLSAVAADGFSDVDVCALGSPSGATITSDVSIPAGSTIALQGPVFVGDENASASLTIGQGTTFFGASAGGTATATDDYLVISAGSRIEAIGTEASPIRFTARGAINDEQTGSNTINQLTSEGLWGGLVINGNAPINACEDATAIGGSAGCTKSGEGSSGVFGGDLAGDNSGTLQFVIVEYAGSRLTNDDELNGIAFQGVGSGTTVDHIQVHNNLDDGIEWFGGTVNAKFVAVTGAGDDSLDWTDGWTGNLQFAAVNSTKPTSGDPRGIEADNLSSNNTATPFSEPSISNFTLIGTPGNQQGILLRRGTKGTVINGIVADYGTGFDVDSTATFDNFNNGELIIQSHFFDNAENFASDADGVPTIPAADNVVTGNNTLSDGFIPGQQELAVPVSAALSADTFFDTTDYIGAFSPTESAGNSWANFTLAGTVFPDTSVAATCPTGTTTNGTLGGKTLCEIDGSSAITSDLRLADGDELVYELVGPVFIGVDQGPDPAAPLAGSASATLTIDPGVTIVGEGDDDYLVIARGSRILSNGTAANPVVFTSKRSIETPSAVTIDEKGVWGGLVINGRAPINACESAAATGGTVGCEKSGEGSSGLFGGATSNDDSGQLFYTRVQYAGVRLTNDDELNGIAFQGVGSGTEVEFVQVQNNLDDCFEWFGGTVSAKYLVSVGCGDDSFDWTDGWQGSLQYGIVYSGVAGTGGGISGDPRGIEGDNLSSNNTATPASTPRISNVTIVSGGDAGSDTGVVLRRGMAGTVANAIVLGWPDAGLDVDSQATIDNFDNGDLQIQSFFLSGNGDDLESDGEDPTFSAANNLVTSATNTMSGFAFRAGRPGLVPGADENAVPVFDVTGIGDLEATTFVGAVEDANDTWFSGWTVDAEGNITQ